MSARLSVEDELYANPERSGSMNTANERSEPREHNWTGNVFNTEGMVHFVQGNVYHYAGVNRQTSALFGVLQALASDAIDDAAHRYRRSRASIESTSNMPTMPLAYLPHVSVSNADLKTALIKIAVVCQFLDTAFAEYFRAVITHLSGTGQKLHLLREEICARQSENMQYIGSFGEYCERINAASGNTERKEQYEARATASDVIPYLQDALEVPYWNMMADQFIKSSHINNQFTYDAVLSVINDKRQRMRQRLHQVKQKWNDSLPREIESGILRRILILDAILAQTSDTYDSLEDQQIQTPQRLPTPGPTSISLSSAPTVVQATTFTAKASANADVTDLEKVSLLSLFLVFTAIAMVPFAMGFAGNWDAASTDAVGSASDPDFKWLTATTLLAIFGNLYAIIPLRKITRGSMANLASQAFLYFSILLGVSSVAVYPFWNKAWSASLSFFCAYFAIGSDFVAAQHTSNTASAQPASSSKIKTS